LIELERGDAADEHAPHTRTSGSTHAHLWLLTRTPDTHTQRHTHPTNALPQDAAVAAISSPLLDFPIRRAKGIVFNVVGGPDMTLAEINAAAEVVYENADSEANIIFGALVDPSLEDEISITVLATGFGDSMSGQGETEDGLTDDYYKLRRQQTSSPLGANATPDETLRFVTGGMKLVRGSSGGEKGVVRSLWHLLKDKF